MKELANWFEKNWDFSAHIVVECVVVKILSILFAPFFGVLVGLGLLVYKEYYYDEQATKSDIISSLIGILLGVL